MRPTFTPRPSTAVTPFSSSLSTPARPSLTEALDTCSATGRLVLGARASLAAFERDLIRERTVAGLAAARLRGARLGRPTVITPAKLAAARTLIDTGSTVTEAAAVIGVSRPTLYRHLAREAV